MIKAIVFDFYGVIIPDLYWNWLGKVVKDLDSKREFFSDLANKVDKGKLNANQYLKKLSKATGIPADKISAQMDKELIINKEIINLVKKLKKSKKIGIVSNSNSYWISDLLRDNNLNQYFDEIVISSEVGYLKPEPEIFQIILERLSVRPEETIFIDDRMKNVDGAINLGVEGILYENIEKLKKDLRTKGFDI